MGETTKTFTEEFIKMHLDSLPDASTYQEDEIEHQIFEGFDSNASERPAKLTVLYLVFGKNETRDGWVLLGYHG